jgi:hypothetical protein
MGDAAPQFTSKLILCGLKGQTTFMFNLIRDTTITIAAITTENSLLRIQKLGKTPLCTPLKSPRNAASNHAPRLKAINNS